MWGGWLLYACVLCVLSGDSHVCLLRIEGLLVVACMQCVVLSLDLQTILALLSHWGALLLTQSQRWQILTVIQGQPDLEKFGRNCC